MHLSHKSPIRRDLGDRKLTSQVETTGSLRLDICTFPECHVAAAWESSQTDPLGETESFRMEVALRGDLMKLDYCHIEPSEKESLIYIFYQYQLKSYPYLLYISIWIFHPAYLFLFRWLFVGFVRWEKHRSNGGF